jgi:pantothenate kinase
MEGAIKLIIKNNLQRGLAYIYATGGGAHRFKDRFKEELGITFTPRDELGTIVR